jgi:hypothetical protein
MSMDASMAGVDPRNLDPPAVVANDLADGELDYEPISPDHETDIKFVTRLEDDPIFNFFGLLWVG